MLILAGVSLNALIGDNGILKQAMNASFLSEMTAVQEAFDTWKVNHYDDDEIPANGLVQVKDIDGNGRIYGEIAYYRRWSNDENHQKPDIDIRSDLNSVYGGDLIYLPRGVEDLYYLDNAKIGIDSDKKYIIDVTNSMIYSVTGYDVDKIYVHSLAMYKAIMNGNNNTPMFAVAEVSGSGSDIVAAGNTGPEYFTNDKGEWTDSEGNVVSTKEEAKNPNYNPYGFELIASPYSNNVFKLYNNGDLYGKGIKGIQLNTPIEEMNKINPYKWKEFSIPSTISSYKKIYSTEAGLFLIDDNDNLWSINTEYGLTDEQRIEYTGRSWIKIDLGKDSSGNGYKASKVFGTSSSVYVITTNNKLLGTGNNRSGQLGTGDKIQKTTFVEISGIPDPSKITSIWASEYKGSGNGNTVIKCVNPTEEDAIGNHFYFAGVVGYGNWGHGLKQGLTRTNFTEIYKGETDLGDDIRNSLNEILIPHYESIAFWYTNGDFEFKGWSMYCAAGKLNIPNVVDVRFSQSLKIFKCNNNGVIEYYGTNKIDASYGIVEGNQGNSTPTKISIPDGINIVDFQIFNNNSAYFLADNGDLYGLGNRYFFDVTDYSEKTWSYTLEKITTINGISTFYGSEFGNSVLQHRSFIFE